MLKTLIEGIGQVADRDRWVHADPARVQVGANAKSIVHLDLDVRHPDLTAKQKLAHELPP